MDYAELADQKVHPGISGILHTICHRPAVRLQGEVINQNIVIYLPSSFPFQQTQQVAAYLGIVEMLRVVKRLNDLIHRNGGILIHLSEISVNLVLRKVLLKTVISFQVKEVVAYNHLLLHRQQRILVR